MSGTQQVPPVNRTTSLIAGRRRRWISPRQGIILGVLAALAVLALIFTNPAHYGKSKSDDLAVAPVSPSHLRAWTPPPPPPQQGITCPAPLIATAAGCILPPTGPSPKPDLVNDNKQPPTSAAPPQPAMVAFNLPPAREHRGPPGAAGASLQGDDATHVAFKGTTLPGTRAGLMEGDDSLTLMPGLIRCVLINDIVNGSPFQCILEGPAKSSLGVAVMDRGTVITGQTDGQVSEGQNTINARSVVAWTPTHPPCGVPLGGPAANALGAAGIPANIDPHSLERFGPAVALSLTDSLFSILQSALSSGNNNTYLAFNTSGVSSLASEILRSQANIKPTGSAHRGDAITIWTDVPINFSACYKLGSR